MQRLLFGLLAIGLVLTALVVLVACGSDGQSPQPTGTEASQRTDRAASVRQQQERVAESQSAVAENGEEAQQQAEARTEQSQQIEAPTEDSEDQQVVELPPDVVGEHKGIRSERHVLGDLDAPVEIRYYGDFT